MMRALLRGKRRAVESGSRARWQILQAQYRRLTQAIRVGDLSEAMDAYDRIRFEQAEQPTLSANARLAFEGLGEAIESGSLADAADGLRLFRLVLEGTSESRRQIPGPDDERPLKTLRSGVVPALGATFGDELPETATLTDIDVPG